MKFLPIIITLTNPRATITIPKNGVFEITEISSDSFTNHKVSNCINNFPSIAVSVPITNWECFSYQNRNIFFSVSTTRPGLPYPKHISQNPMSQGEIMYFELDQEFGNKTPVTITINCSLI